MKISILSSQIRGKVAETFNQETKTYHNHLCLFPFPTVSSDTNYKFQVSKQ